MKVLKRLIVILSICLTVAMVLPVEFINNTMIVEAHSGRTDGNGGHKDNGNKSGLGHYHYHYHCGSHPAHLHQDGICPYAGIISSESASVANTSVENTSKIVGNYTQIVPDTNNISALTVEISGKSYDNVAFNASYYASNNADLYQIYGDNAKSLYDHFMTYGIQEGRQSSAQFSILAYVENNSDLVDAFGDDLIQYNNHFIAFGVNENRVAKK